MPLQWPKKLRSPGTFKTVQFRNALIKWIPLLIKWRGSCNNKVVKRKVNCVWKTDFPRPRSNLLVRCSTSYSISDSSLTSGEMKNPLSIVHCLDCEWSSGMSLSPQAHLNNNLPRHSEHGEQAIWNEWISSTLRAELHTVLQTSTEKVSV